MMKENRKRSSKVEYTNKNVLWFNGNVDAKRSQTLYA